MGAIRSNDYANEDLQKKVIVTAGASGIGLAVARSFLSEGAKVWICDVDQKTLDQVLSENKCLRGLVADVGRPEQVETFFTKSIESMGGVDVLVNNAGIGGPRDAIENIAYQDWDDCIRINLSGMFYCSKQVIPVMKQQQSGCIINISTTSAKTGLPNRLPYVASKVGVLGLTHNLARELGQYGIRCNTVMPGLMDNARGRMLVDKLAAKKSISQQEAEEEYLKYISLRSWIQPSDIAETVCYLTSPQAKHITAQEIAVDGNIEWEQ
ncbi:SDR family oxidoreductase [SAR92 clade bacterium H246]